MLISSRIRSRVEVGTRRSRCMSSYLYISYDSFLTNIYQSSAVGVISRMYRVSVDCLFGNRFISLFNPNPKRRKAFVLTQDTWISSSPHLLIFSKYLLLDDREKQSYSADMRMREITSIEYRPSLLNPFDPFKTLSKFPPSIFADKKHQRPNVSSPNPPNNLPK